MSDITVIICYFKRRNLIQQTLESVTRQSVSPGEIILIDDGSEDGVEEVVSNYPTIQYHEHINRGVSASRNVGIKLATGDRILFLDDDDLITEDAIQKLSSLGNDSDTVGALACKNFSHSVDEDNQAVWRFKTGEGWLPQLFLGTLPIHSYLLPKSLLVQAGGFDESMTHSEDWDLWLRLAVAGAKLKYIDQVGGYYRQHTNSVSKNHFAMIYSRAKVLCRCFEEIEHHPLFRNTWAPHFLRACWSTVRHLDFYARFRQLEVSDLNHVRGVLENVLVQLHNEGIRVGSQGPLLLRLLHSGAGKPGTWYWRCFNQVLAATEYMTGGIKF